jgi:hypothetical protein
MLTALGVLLVMLVELILMRRLMPFVVVLGLMLTLLLSLHVLTVMMSGLKSEHCSIKQRLQQYSANATEVAICHRR